VPDMEMTLVDYFDVHCGESLAQLDFDAHTPIGRIGHEIQSADDRCDQEVVTGIVRTCG
jgi:hypothetical protein